MADYGPALINLGNLYYLQEDMGEALEYYTLARTRVPDNKYLLLALARAYHRVGEYARAQEFYAELMEADALLAARFPYLESAGGQGWQAGGSGGAGDTMLWAE